MRDRYAGRVHQLARSCGQWVARDRGCEVHAAGWCVGYLSLGVGVFGRSGVKSASDLAGKLLREAHVATVPGEGFGTRDHIPHLIRNLGGRTGPRNCRRREVSTSGPVKTLVPCSTARLAASSLGFPISACLRSRWQARRCCQESFRRMSKLHPLLMSSVLPPAPLGENCLISRLSKSSLRREDWSSLVLPGTTAK